MRILIAGTLASAVVAGTPAAVGAQSPIPPVHKHYERPPEYNQAPDPGKPLAPRLQNLGAHTFKVTTSSARPAPNSTSRTVRR